MAENSLLPASAASVSGPGLLDLDLGDEVIWSRVAERLADARLGVGVGVGDGVGKPAAGDS